MDAKYEEFAKAWAPYVEPDAMAGFYYLMQHSGSFRAEQAVDADISLDPDDVERLR
jgi:hypothetical protein